METSPRRYQCVWESLNEVRPRRPEQSIMGVDDKVYVELSQ